MLKNHVVDEIPCQPQWQMPEKITYSCTVYDKISRHENLRILFFKALDSHFVNVECILLK